MKPWIFSIVLLLLTPFSQAADVVEQRYIDQMTRGGNTSLKQAAQSIYNTNENNTEVLDVAAEVLLQRYGSATKQDLDTLAWVAKSIGQSGNGRYYTALKQVVDSDAPSKLRKYAKKSLKAIGSASGEQYTAGMINLQTLKKSKPKAKPKSAAKKNTGKADISVIVNGMTMQEVYDLLGSPTNTTNRQTGKAWIPFNFGGKDMARTISIYKGQGRVIFSHDAYSGTPKVIEVIVDPNESGYP